LPVRRGLRRPRAIGAGGDNKRVVSSISAQIRLISFAPITSSERYLSRGPT
jgi:hypothetical protein